MPKACVLSALCQYQTIFVSDHPQHKLQIVFTYYKVSYWIKVSHMIPPEWTNGIAYDLCFIGNTLRSYPFLKLFTYNWNRKSCKVGILRYQYFCEKSGSRRNILQTVFCCMGNYHFIVQDIYSQTLQYQLNWGNNVSSACICNLYTMEGHSGFIL